jgi:Zn-dependent oligopeptidase
MTDAANPLLTHWDTPFGLPPFAAIEDGHFGPAMDAALDEGRANIAAIADNPEPPTFANTIEALELADATLDRVAGCVLQPGRVRTRTPRGRHCSASSRRSFLPIPRRSRTMRACSRGWRTCGTGAMRSA